MLHNPRHRRPPARARRYLGIAAALLVTGAAIAVPPSLASAADAEVYPVSPGWGKQAESLKPFKGGKDQLPPGAVKTDRAPAKPGARAAVFEAPGVSPQIVGGTIADPADFPGVVGIQTFFLFDSDNDGLSEVWVATCTGTVLSPTKVLTAGHCTVGFNYGTTEVIAGRQNLATDTAGFVSLVATTWTHQNFNYAMLGVERPLDDVAVLTLKNPLPAAYVPVTLAAQGADDVVAETPATIVGYGVTSSVAEDSGVLRRATVPIKADATCATEYGADFDGNRMLCAGIPPTTNTCYGDSGGPIFAGGTQVGITDWGSRDCVSTYGVYEALNHYSDIIKADLVRTGLVNLDFTGDGHSDFIGRLNAPGTTDNGALVALTGSGLASDGQGGFNYPGWFVGRGFGSFTKLFRVTNWHGDKTESIFGRDAAGNLYEWTTDGRGDFTNGGNRRLIGTGWNKFTDIMVTNNWTGNGMPNLMGRTAGGELWRYDSNGSGGWSNPRGTLIGSGWNKFDTVLTPGSWLGDGHQSLIGRTSTGDLWLYNSDGSGGWTNPRGTLIGTGWSNFRIFMSPGDWSGDDIIDLVGIRPTGEMRLYATNGRGAWLNGRGIQISVGWNDFNTVF
ncbi:MAG TPA: trypsin-like serine protease [Asanoa sp.]